MLKNTLYALACLFILAGLIHAIRTEPERSRAYNKHMCAVYGYAEDCKTPLDPDQRLK